MATASDNFANLRRCVALLTAAKPLPADVQDWLTATLAAIVSGADPGDVLGVTRHARLQSRDDRLRALAALAPGGVTSKARTVDAWLRSAAEAPAAAVPIMAEVPDPPGWRQILRVLRGSRSGDAVSEPPSFDTRPAGGVMAAWLQRAPVRKAIK